MKIFLFVLRKTPGLTVLAMLTALTSGLLSGSLIALIHRALDTIDSPEQMSGQMGLTFALLVVLTLMSAIASNIIIAHLYRNVLLDLQRRLAHTITQAPLRKLEEMGSASLLALFTEDLDDISETATELVPLIINLVTSLVCCGYLLWLSWQAFVGTFIFLVIGGVSYQLLVSREQDILMTGREKIDHLYHHFHDLTDGIKELKLNHRRRQAFLDDVLGATTKSVQHYMFIWDVAYSVISAWGRFLILMVVGLILFLLPHYLNLQPGVLTGYILALLYVRSSLLSVIDAIPELAEAAVALQKVEAVGLDLAAEEIALDSTPGITQTSTKDLEASPTTQSPTIQSPTIQSPTTQSPTTQSRVKASEASLFSTPWQSLTLVNITHRYYREREDSEFTLGPINLAFKPGELVFLVGGNGSGKTTLAKLITGLYAQESGEIYVDGVAVGDRHRPHYSQLFSAIFTDFHLFDDLLGLSQDDLDTQVKDYLSKLHLDHKLKVQDGRFSTTALSRGQRQRLALLVAYLDDRSFYVFDEWAANQDPVFKEVFYRQFLPELKVKGKTVLVISHDDRYFGEGDRILKLTDGQLEEVT